MTLIIGIEDAANDRAIVAADSGCWKGDQADITRTPKIWRSNGWIAGLTGTWAQSLRLRQLPFESLSHDATREDAETALLAWSLTALAKVAELHELVRRADDGEHPRSPALVVAWRRWLWYVMDGEATSVTRGFMAAGTADYATGALSALSRTGATGLTLAEHGMRAVYDITRLVKPPFVWMATDGTEGVWE